MAGSVIVMNPNNGEILALANWPDFNPNEATNAPAEARMNRVGERGVRAGIDVQVDHAGGGFRPEGITVPTKFSIASTASIYVIGPRIHDHKPFGLAECGGNSGEIERRRRDQDCAAGWATPKFYDYIRAFGFGAPTGVDMPGESRGMLREAG